MRKIFKFLVYVVILIAHVLLTLMSDWCMLIAFVLIAFDEDVLFLKALIISLIFFAAAILIILFASKKIKNKKRVVFNIICLVISVVFFAWWFYLCTPMMDLDRMIADKMDAWLACLLILMNLSYVILNGVLLIKSFQKLKKQNS